MCISTFLVLIIVLVSMELYSAGPQHALQKLASAVRIPTPLSALALSALCLLLLCQPLVDVANWQALAALRRRGVAEPARDAAMLRGVFDVYAAETAFAWLWMAILGAIAMLAIPSPGVADVVQSIVRRMIAADDLVTNTALGLLVIAIFAMALSTMSTQLSALLCTIRYDMFASSDAARAPSEQHAWRRSYVAVWVLVLIVATAVGAFEAFREIGFGGERILAWLLAAGSVQLALLPLVATSIVDRMRRAACKVTARWALTILGSGASAALAAVGIHILTGSDAWLWAAAPACLASGGIILLFAWIASTRS